MKEYILNETPIKTTNNFKMNNINLNLDLSGNDNFKDFKIINGDNLDIKINKNGGILTSKIGLEFNKSYVIDITVKKDIHINEPVYLTYEFKDDDLLVDNINITYEENSKADFILKYVSLDNGKHIHQLKENIKASKASNGSISIINLLNKDSYNFIAIDGSINNEAIIKHNIFDLGATVNLSNVDLDLKDYKASHYLNSLYIGTGKDVIDINYYIKNIGQKSINNINTKGALLNNSIKHFKGIIDFIEGAKDAVGKEQENCILLSDNCISRSLPMLLCHEENVDGAHGVSSGKIDEEKLFYLMSRGFSKEEALKLIIKASFSEIVNNVNDLNLQNEIYSFIDKAI